jgi:hypothetical protein
MLWIDFKLIIVALPTIMIAMDLMVCMVLCKAKAVT